MVVRQSGGIDPPTKNRAGGPVGGLPMGGPPLTPPSVSPLLCTPPREQPKPGAQLRTIIFPGNFPPPRNRPLKKFSSPGTTPVSSQSPFHSPSRPVPLRVPPSKNFPLSKIRPLFRSVPPRSHPVPNQSFPTSPVLSQALSERRVFLGRGALLQKVGFAKKFSMVENASRKVGIAKKFSMVFLYL